MRWIFPDRRLPVFWLILVALANGPNTVLAGSSTADFTKAKSVLLGEAIQTAQLGDEFRATALLELAREQNLLRNDARLPLLYLARRYEELDLPDQALALYRIVAEQTRNSSEADQAWLTLAKLAIGQGQLARAEQALPHIGDRLGKEQRIEHQLIEALVALYNRDEKGAVRAIPKFKYDTTWSLYQRYNIAVTLLSHYRNKRGALMLSELGRLEAGNDPDWVALRDQANLALGYSLLQLNKPRQARKYLSRINLDTFMANQALLGMGWAYSADDELEKALVYWLELENKKITTTYLYEALLAVPYGFGRAGAVGQAAEAYENTVRRFDADIVAIDAAREEIQRGKLAALVKADDPADEFSWVAEWQRQPAVGVAYFVPLLMESPAYQQALKEVRTLLRLKARLAQMSSAFEPLESHPDREFVATEIAAAKRRYEAIGQDFDQALSAMEEKLATVAVDILDRHQNLLRDYAKQARFGLAQAIGQAAFGHGGEQ